MSGQVRIKKRAAFLANLRVLGLVGEAAKRTGISRNTPYLWAKQSKEFATAFGEAKQEGGEVLADHLEEALKDRAINGWDEGVFYKGAKVGSNPRFSDTAAIFLLKGVRPHKYMEQLVGIGVSGGQVVVNVKSFASFQPAPVGTPSGPTVIETVALPPNPAPAQEE